MNNPTRLTVIPNLLVEHGRIDRSMRDHETIADAMRSEGWQPEMVHARVFVDGELIDQARWERLVPQRGSSICIRRIPMGGGGGGGKQAGMLIGMIAVMALAIAAPYAIPGLATFAGATGGLWGGIVGALGPGSLGAFGLSAGISVAGMLAVRALIPPPLPRRLTEVAREKPVSVSAPVGRVDHVRRFSECPAGNRRSTRLGRRQELATRT